MPQVQQFADANKKVIEKIASGDPQLKKQAEYTLSSMVRIKLRENGIARSNMLPPIQATTPLDRTEDPTVLRQLVEVEPDSKATWIPLRGMPEAQIVETRLVPCYFGKIESQNHIANIWELKNYNNDLRKIINDQDAKNIQEQEDTAIITRFNQLAALNPLEQDIHLFGGLNKVSWAQARQAFYPDKPKKFALMNVRTAMEFSKWNLTEDMGYGPAGAEMFKNGVLTQIHGLQIIQTIKTSLVPDGVVFIFAPEDYIGKFLVLQEPTTFIEQKKDWITFSTYEVVGFVIANTKCFIKCTFHP